MAEERLHMRVSCKERCRLHFRDRFYPGIADDISLGDVLVHFSDMPPGIHVGDNCNLVLDGNFDYEFFGEIVRTEYSKIAFRFNDKDLPDRTRSYPVPKKF